MQIISAIIAAIAIIQYQCSRSSISQTAAGDKSAAASMATELIAATSAILIGKSTASQQCNFKRHQLSYRCRHECMSSEQISSGLLEICKQRNATITYNTLRIYPTISTYLWHIRAVSDHIYGTKFWKSHSFMCIVSRISIYYAGLWYKGILHDQKQIHQCFRTTSGPISSLALKFSRFRGSVTKSIFYISARTSFIVRFYIFETLE